MSNKQRFTVLFTILIFVLSSNKVASQSWIEPQVEELQPRKSLYERGIRYGLGLDIHINDYGFGVGFNYRRLLNSGSELVFDAMIGSLRDEREQDFQSYYYGEVTPNKFNRVLSFPILLGYKQRLFSQHLDDNFRLFLQGSGGPSFAWVTPYFNDFDNNGLRTTDPNLGPIEGIYDVFSGWDEGEFKTGYTAQLMLSFDIGTTYNQYTSIRIGYIMNYFSDPIQIMEPNRFKTNNRGQILVDINGFPLIEKANGPQSYFGSPLFQITFGGLW